MPSPPFDLGVDTGGTFVDCVVLDAAGRALGAKALATPDQPAAGVMAAVGNSAGAAGMGVDDLLGRTARLVYGTTSGLNALVTRTGTRVGLLATRGHEDAVLVGRIHQKVAGLSPDEITAAAKLSKPEPLVPRWLIRGIHERTDHLGQEVVPLDLDGVVGAVDELVAEGCEAVAVSFLWSFLDARHERAAAEAIRRRHPALRVCISSEVAPVIGEYERTAATVVNAYLGDSFERALRDVQKQLMEHGFAGTLCVMLSSGAIAPAEEVVDQAVATLGSGPVGGLLSAQRLGAGGDVSSLVTTDMGGTSFDVGLVVDGKPHLLDAPVFARLHLAVQAMDVRSIGAGGGSVAWMGDDGSIHVGPRSAAAEPGPACYGRGGTEPTVTDADLLLGRLNPEALLGGRLALDRGAAEQAVGALAARLHVDLAAAAAGIVRVADAKMADLVRKVMFERGQDPRGFTMVAFGGAAPLHVGAYGPDVGVAEVVVPALASVFSAHGLAGADWRRVHVRSDPMRAPFDRARVSAIFEELEEVVRREHRAGGVEEALLVERTVDLRYGRQTHQVPTPLDDGALDEAALAQLCDRFEAAYERIFGPSTGYRQAGIEAMTFRVVASAPRERERPTVRPSAAGSPAPSGHRAVFFRERVDPTPVFAAAALRPGHRLLGPAVVDADTTTLVLHPGQEATVDERGDVRVRFPG